MEQPDIDDHLSRDARERLQQTLAPGETLLWAAVPACTCAATDQTSSQACSASP